ncbi:MAG: hypothetical protein WAN17_06180 [Candidatus Sulfotelmatobacter sp.]
MRAFRFLNLAILSLLIGGSALVYAQDDKPQQEDKPAQQEELKKQDEAKPGHQDEAKPSKQEKQEDKQMQKQEEKNSHDQGKPEGQEHPEQQMEHARQGGKSAHIPDDKFRAHFGRSHTFKARTVIVEGQPQFQYGGYSFQLVDAWPVGWAYTDDCYIDYIDGEYFLFDLLHPGVRVAIIVVM